MNGELIQALRQIEKERAISLDKLAEALESALASAYKRNFDDNQNIVVHIDRNSGRISVMAIRTVVEKASQIEDPDNQLALKEARKLDPTVEVGGEVRREVTPPDFGRIAAQTANQVFKQRIRELEREMVFDEYVNRVDDLVSGVVQRYEQRNLLIDLGRAEAMLPQTEMVPGEYLRYGTRIKAYCLDVRRTTRGPQVVVSRSHPNLIKRLFELEVPELNQGTVEIKAVVREPGHRSKIAVASNDLNVDPVGACVGAKGSRVQAVVDELRGEKIDIIPWSDDPLTFISKALSPAKVVSVSLYEDQGIALVVVPDGQLSLAIGREGQNARLAARLTGWKIDIKSETQFQEMESEGAFEEEYRPEQPFGEGEVGEAEEYVEYVELVEGEMPEGEYEYVELVDGEIPEGVEFIEIVEEEGPEGKTIRYVKYVEPEAAEAGSSPQDEEGPGAVEADAVPGADAS